MPITENRVKMAVFDPFLLEFWSKFGHTFFSKFILYSGITPIFSIMLKALLVCTLLCTNFWGNQSPVSEKIIFGTMLPNYYINYRPNIRPNIRSNCAEYSVSADTNFGRIGRSLIETATNPQFWEPWFLLL